MSSTNTGPIRILMLGSGGVGKTSMINSLLGKPFEEGYSPTIADDFEWECTLEKSSVPHNTTIMDLSGQDDFRPVVDIALREAVDAAICVFAATSLVSFNNLENFVNDIRKNQKDAVIIVAGNKQDCIESGEPGVIPEEQIEEKISMLKVDYQKCSAKTGDNVTKIFEMAVSKALQKRSPGKAQTQSAGGDGTGCCTVQ